ncbi:MAG: hypothetical protein KatS3mg002_0499 [Candidatus Woesearchaeota archaeon]|nr:MAG: hypothetical protein KatS3mg002_0499 [Candidatus Woesearchaeota archaeon]
MERKYHIRQFLLKGLIKIKDDEWKQTNSLRITDIPKAVLVLTKAYEYLALNSEEEEDIY